MAAYNPGNGNTNDLIQRFREDCNLRDMVATMDYVCRAKEYCAFLEARGKNPLNADREDLRAFLARLKARGLKFKTIDRIHSCLSAFYEFLIVEDLVEYNPILPFRKYYLRRYKNDSDSEIRKLISVEDASRLVNSVLDSRDKCILVLLFKTGMRVRELTSLDVSDVDLDKVKLRSNSRRSDPITFCSSIMRTLPFCRDVWSPARTGRARRTRRSSYHGEERGYPR